MNTSKLVFNEPTIPLFKIKSQIPSLKQNTSTKPPKARESVQLVLSFTTISTTQLRELF